MVQFGPKKCPTNMGRCLDLSQGGLREGVKKKYEYFTVRLTVRVKSILLLKGTIFNQSLLLKNRECPQSLVPEMNASLSWHGNKGIWKIVQIKLYIHLTSICDFGAPVFPEQCS